MTRTLKFRAWDVHGKKYSYSDEYPTGLEGFFCHHEGRPIEQFTGLHDKAEREIYEGDVIALNGSSNGVRTCGAVVFKNGGFFIDLGEFGLHSVYRSTMLDPIYNNTGEVIGNIRENSQLLNAA